ncbi:MAG: exodeoxyribonuclease VII small subunit [Betaproteobacteria bacterium]|nr:exodeoxyribonuclease VII small subunit [Betaproteobacteria bacterium]
MSKPTPAKAVAAPSFEEALAELEAIVTTMEGGQMPLEASLSAYQRGAELLRHCQEVLAEAQQKVKILEGGVLKGYEAGNGVDAER